MAHGVPALHPEEKGALDISPKSNWVQSKGGLPPYINSVAVALVRKGMTRSRAIATAVNTMKKTCATGLWGGHPGQNVSPAVRAAACSAVARWESMKAAAKADMAIPARDRRVLELAFAKIDREERVVELALKRIESDRIELAKQRRPMQRLRRLVRRAIIADHLLES